ncbi:MAG: hypothetical protein ACLTDR_05480 [Adlercreutzia equolifaciens]
MARRDLWPRVEPLLSRVERPARYLNHEWGCAAPVAEGDFAFCMIYPDTYELGQANQAVRILVNAVNAMGGMGAERAFLPAVDMADLMREEGVPLFSLESCRPVADFDVVGITLPHELAATNVLETLDLAGIPLRTADRAEGDPIVLAGGPCAYNPEPYAPFFDVILVGEGEEQLPEVLALIRELRASGAPGPRFCARWRGAWGRLRAEPVPLAQRGRGPGCRQLGGAPVRRRAACGAQARLRGFRRQPGA